MQRALRLAERGRGRTSPNPMVGAVLVRDGEVVGEGYHHAVGAPHAEVEAIRAAGDRARGADLYVTLEPCCHHGRTGPCTEAVIAAGVSRVIAGMVDPNPSVSGQGLARMSAAGLDVRCGVLEESCRTLNEGFISAQVAGRPFVTLKLAATLDGRLAAPDGSSRWVTGPAARARVHRMRARDDAVAVGSGTALADDPELTARTAGGRPCRRQPRRLVFDARLRLLPGARMLREPGGGPVIVLTVVPESDPRAQALAAAGARVVQVPADGQTGGLHLETALSALPALGVLSVLCEGGAALGASLLKNRLVDRLAVFLAPKLMGGARSLPMLGDLGVETMSDVLQLGDLRVERVGPDLLVLARP